MPMNKEFSKMGCTIYIIKKVTYPLQMSRVKSNASLSVI